MSVYIGEVPTFADVADTKEQALKVLEEAAEVLGAVQHQEGIDVLAECADVVQAVCNLVSAYGIHHFNGCMDECRARNEERGRVYAQA